MRRRGGEKPVLCAAAAAQVCATQPDYTPVARLPSKPVCSLVVFITSTWKLLLGTFGDKEWNAPWLSVANLAKGGLLSGGYWKQSVTYAAAAEPVIWLVPVFPSIASASGPLLWQPIVLPLFCNLFLVVVAIKRHSCGFTQDIERKEGFSRFCNQQQRDLSGIWISRGR